MKLNEFKEKVYHHLSSYRKTTQMGTWNGKEYPHILFVKNDTYDEKAYVIKKYGGLLNDIINFDFILNENELHKNAHHLNSSQIMCYNFFRPLIDDKIQLTYLFKEIGINCFGLLESKFEYEDGLDNFSGHSRQTNFDFYVGNKNCGIYCEIKYTESKFGDCKKDKEHINKFEKYKPLLRLILKKDINLNDITIDNFSKYYQLFRNAIRANNKNHCLFIIPKDREDLVKEFNDWHSKFIKNDLDIRIVYWENLVQALKNIGMNKHAVLFEDRYLKY